MNTAITVVKASHLMPFISFLEKVGAPVDALLAEVNLHRDFFSHAENLVAEPPCWAFIGLAAKKQGIADLGFQVTEQLSLDNFGTFGIAVMQANTLYLALTVFIAEMGKQSNCPPFWLEENEQGLWFYRLGTQGIKKGNWQVEQHVVSMMIQLVRAFTSNKWTPPYVDLQTHSLKGAENTASFKNSQVIINRPYTGIFIPNTLLANKAVVSTELGSIKPSVKQKHISSVNCQVLKELIAQSSYTRTCSAEQIAEALGMNVRQMQRVLKQENSCFRQLSEQALFEQAKIMLDDNDCSILNIAIEFGYSDAANFTRAFKRWSGLSPTQYKDLMS